MLLFDPNDRAPAELRRLVLSGELDLAELLAASAAEQGGPWTAASAQVRCFLPSLNQLPEAVERAAGSQGRWLRDLSMRRLWTVGPHVYQPLAAWLEPAGAPGPLQLLVRRKHTLEPVVLAGSGSPLQALVRALQQLAYLRRPQVSAGLLPELARRSLHAGIAPVTEVRQALVVTTAEVLAGHDDLPAIGRLRAQLEPGPLGFRFLESVGAGDELQLRAASGAWDPLQLVRPV